MFSVVIYFAKGPKGQILVVARENQVTSFFYSNHEQFAFCKVHQCLHFCPDGIQEPYALSDFESGHKEAALRTLNSLFAPYIPENQSLHRAIEVQDKYCSHLLWLCCSILLLTRISLHSRKTVKILLFSKEIIPRIDEVNPRQEIPLAHAIKSNNSGIGWPPLYAKAYLLSSSH